MSIPKTASGFFLGERLNQDKYLIVLVGLPARGKSYIARKLCRYLNWLNIKSKVFNAGDFRRRMIGAGQPAEFFDFSNEAGMRAREEVARETLEDLFSFLNADGVVGVFDATNTTRRRRQWVAETSRREGFQVLFLESIVTDTAIVARNVLATKTKLNPDYSAVQLNPEEAMRDFLLRLKHYEAVYEEVEPKEGESFVKIINQGQELRLFKIHGWIPSRLTFFLMNVHIGRRRIWLCRHGESMYNKEERIGGDSPLSERGVQFSHKLKDFILNRLQVIRSEEAQEHAQEALQQLMWERQSASDSPVERGSTAGSASDGSGPSPITGTAGAFSENQDEREPLIWTSTLQRSKQTGRPLSKHFSLIQWKCLDEIDAGDYDGMTYHEIEEKYPDEFSARAADKFGYRYPRGESYYDCINRVEPCLVELERCPNDLIIVTHQAIVRVLFSYFSDLNPSECTTLPVPLHRVYEFVPLAHGVFSMQYFDVDI